MLNKMVKIIAKPGNNTVQGADQISSSESLIIAPHSGIGRCAPREIKLNAVISKIATTNARAISCV